MSRLDTEFFGLNIEKAEAWNKEGVNFREEFSKNSNLAFWSASLHKLQLVSYFFSLGCDYSKPNENGHTPIIGACRKDRDDVVLLLAEKGIDPKKPDQTGLYPIIAAADARAIKTFDTLVDLGVPLDVRDSQGRTVAHYAVKEWTHHEIYRLHELGVSLSEKDNNGITPLQIAEWGQNFRAANMIRKILDISSVPNAKHSTIRASRPQPRVSDEARRQNIIDELLRKANRLAEVRSRLNKKDKGDRGSEKE